jgi:hypothetical protein
MTGSSNTSDTHNSSRHRIGDPIASQSAKSKHVVEKDFSPPESVFVCRPLSLFRVMSGSTWEVLVAILTMKQSTLTCMSSSFSLCLIIRVPRNCRSDRKYKNEVLARIEICSLNLCQRSLRVWSEDFNCCKKSQFPIRTA